MKKVKEVKEGKKVKESDPVLSKSENEIVKKRKRFRGKKKKKTDGEAKQIIST